MGAERWPASKCSPLVPTQSRWDDHGQGGAVSVGPIRHACISMCPSNIGPVKICEHEKRFEIWKSKKFQLLNRESKCHWWYLGLTENLFVIGGFKGLQKASIEFSLVLDLLFFPHTRKTTTIHTEKCRYKTSLSQKTFYVSKAKLCRGMKKLFPMLNLNWKWILEA